MKRIGILGGTFNPIHVGHLAMAQTAVNKCRLDAVIFVPCSLPPHKNIRHLVPAADRLRMVQLAIKGNTAFQCSDYEIKKGGKSYTIETLRHFHRSRRSRARLFFIIGGDNFKQLRTWRDIADIQKIATFIVINRPGHLARGAAIGHIAVEMPAIGVSASYIRHCVRQGQSVRYFVPDAVQAYINRKKLYRA